MGKCVTEVHERSLEKVNDFEGFSSENYLQNIHKRIVKLVELSVERDKEDIEELLEKESEELMKEELMELEEESM